MLGYRNSYWKTVVLAGASGTLMIATAYLPFALGTPHPLLTIAASLMALPLLGVAAGGCVVLYRDQLQRCGRRDLFHALNDSRTEDALTHDSLDGGLAVLRFFRNLFHVEALLVGDRVRVRTFNEIRATLDNADRLDGLPFLPEMLRYCGEQGMVFRRVDKIYDYGGKKDLRRLKHCVLLANLRCDGAAHGACQAACYLLWNEQWLQRVDLDTGSTARTADEPARNGEEPAFSPQFSRDAEGVTRYTCQFTQLVKASTPMRKADARPDLRPLLAGNVTLSGFLAVLLTRLFNYAQSIRGGISFPFVPSAGVFQTPTTKSDLQPGDTVRVLSPEKIGLTLDKKGRNRGLWFDRDMVKYCGRIYQVLRRVDRIIDDVTGEMRLMKTPCIVLKDAQYSGEYLRLGAQQDQLFWREIWLSSKLDAENRAETAASPVAEGSSHS